MLLALRILTVPVLLFFSTFAYAGDYDFRLHNRSSGWIIDGFYTYQNGRWSNNWLHKPIRSGQGVNMHWASDEGNCRAGSVCLNRSSCLDKWLSAFVMLPAGLRAAG